MFSKTCEYGLKACVFIAIDSEKGNRLGIQDIADKIGTPMYFTGKILQQLVKAQLIKSSKGPHGGFYLPLDADPLPVIKILEVLGCDQFFHQCALGLDRCSDLYPCPMHSAFKPFREGLHDLLIKTTIQELAKDIRKGNAHIIDLDISLEGKKDAEPVNDKTPAKSENKKHSIKIKTIKK